VKFRQTIERAWRSQAAAVAGQAVIRPVGVETEDLLAVDAPPKHNSTSSTRPAPNLR